MNFINKKYCCPSRNKFALSFIWISQNNAKTKSKVSLMQIKTYNNSRIVQSRDKISWRCQKNVGHDFVLLEGLLYGHCVCSRAELSKIVLWTWLPHNKRNLTNPDIKQWISRYDKVYNNRLTESLLRWGEYDNSKKDKESDCFTVRNLSIQIARKYPVTTHSAIIWNVEWNRKSWYSLRLYH